MRELLTAALKASIEQIKADAVGMPLDRWNEAVFRFVFATKLPRDVKQFHECKKIDLVLHRGDERVFVEFKFYQHPVAYDPITGIKGGMKGGPGTKNRKEFEDGVETLRRRPAPREVIKVVALFFSDPTKARGKFSDYLREPSAKLTTLISVGPFLCDGNTCYASLYEVGFK